MSEIKVRAIDSVFDPMRRRDILVPERSTVRDIVQVAYADMPRATQQDLVVVRIGDQKVPMEAWERVRPKADVPVDVRVVPGSDVLRNVLNIAVIASAVALGQFYGPLLANAAVFGAGSAGSGLLGSAAGLAITGSTPLTGPMVENMLDQV